VKAVLLSGSSASQSSNTKLLQAIANLNSFLEVEFGPQLSSLPLYSADNDNNIDLPNEVVAFRQQIKAAQCMIISTPEYLHNIPAVLKNSLEWLKSGGELQAKRVIAICYTPKEPRGEKAMQSLLNSLLALEASVVCKLHLFHDDIKLDSKDHLLPSHGLEMILESLALLK